MRSTKLFSVIDGARPVLRLLRVTFFVICLNLISLPLRAQERALSTNLADYAAGGTFNAEASRSLSRHWSAVAQVKYNPFVHKQRLFAAGAVSDRLLKTLSSKGKDITLIARDFTKFFITPETYTEFIRRGNRLQVLQRSKLIAITLNPTSPQGYLLDSKSTCDALSEAMQVPVYDVMKI